MSFTLIPRRAYDRPALTLADRNLRRRLIFQDTLSLLGLTAVLIVVAVITYYFFQSFIGHRQVLEERWYTRGQHAMAVSDPQYAVQAFQSALSLSTANPKYELALAEALAASNRNLEAYAYFSSLHDAQPGDGFLNLQLARLSVKRGEPAQAIAYYRAALTGLWHGRGAEQRFQVRLELAKYLMSLGRNTEAQGDLLTAEGNSLDHPAHLLEVAELLHKAGDPSDAWTTYRRVEQNAASTPAQVSQALAAEAHAAVSMGQYKRAAQALRRYIAQARRHPTVSTPKEQQAARQQLDHLDRLLGFVPFPTLSPTERAGRLMKSGKIAHQRYTKCLVQANAAETPNSIAEIAPLGPQWKKFGRLTLRRLARDASLQSNLLAWINQAEILTAQMCGPPAGDDAILLQLARNPDTSE